MTVRKLTTQQTFEEVQRAINKGVFVSKLRVELSAEQWEELQRSNVQFYKCSVVVDGHNLVEMSGNDGFAFRKCAVKLSGKFELTEHWFRDCTILADSAISIRELPNDQSVFRGCKFQEVEFESIDARPSDCSFVACRFAGRTSGKFWNCRLSSCDCSKTTFHRCRFSETTAIPVKFSANTQFEDCDVSGLSVMQLDLMNLKDRGGLRHRDLLSMKIKHDLADLRSSFSGFMQWIHIIALVAFLSPYLWFIGQKLFASFRVEEQDAVVSVLEDWVDAKPFGDTPQQRRLEDKTVYQRAKVNTIQEHSMLLQLTYYITSGGSTCREWRPNEWAVALFCFVCLYNAVRAFFLWYTKTLEEKEQISGIPSDFSFSQRRGLYWLYRGSFWMGVGNILASTAHLVMFSLHDFPLT